MAFLKEIFSFVAQRRKFWLAPILLIVVALAPLISRRS